MSARNDVAAFDRGDILWTIEMGGMGPGYEQALQIAAVEIVRGLVGKELPQDPKGWSDLMDPILHAADRELDLGLSGAQAGAAKAIAHKVLTLDGWQPMVDQFRRDCPDQEDRPTMISRHWPKPREMETRQES